MSRIVSFEHADNTNSGLSPGLWTQMPPDVLYNPAVSYWFFEDFIAPNMGASGDGTQLTILEGDANADIALLSDEVGGVIQFQVDTLANTEASLTVGDGVGAFKYNGLFPLAWECRFQVSSVTDVSVFVGLTEEGAGVDAFLADTTGAPADKDYVAFRSLDADSDGLDAVHNTASGGGETVVKEEAQVMVADTWYKVGAISDGSQVGYYVNGVNVASTTESATNFPNGEELTFTMAVKLGGTTACNFEVDWFAVAQLRA